MDDEEADNQTGEPMNGSATVAEAADTPAAVPAAVHAPSITPPAGGSRQDVFTLDEGAVVLQWPGHLSAASYEDFEGWLNLVLRKVKRSVVDEDGED